MGWAESLCWQTKQRLLGTVLQCDATASVFCMTVCMWQGLLSDSSLYIRYTTILFSWSYPVLQSILLASALAVEAYLTNSHRLATSPIDGRARASLPLVFVYVSMPFWSWKTHLIIFRASFIQGSSYPSRVDHVWHLSYSGHLDLIFIPLSLLSLSCNPIYPSAHTLHYLFLFMSQSGNGTQLV